MKSKKFQLKNGLKVIAIESKKSPVVSVQIWVKTGSADEKKGEEGISHFIEHLVFKGSEKYGVGEIASVIESSGGELNAYTSFDQTVFHVTISKEYIDVAFDTISQMMGKPLFEASEIDNEREVVIEEIKRSHDSPHRKASRLLFSTVYKKHPYSLPVIGFDKNIREFSPKKIKTYFQNHYNAKNMFLLVVGDFQSDDLKVKIPKYFSGFTGSKYKKHQRPVEPAQKSARIAFEKSNFEETLINMGWRIPNVKHKDVVGLEILSFVLGQGESSRLMKRLAIEEANVKYAAASTFTPKEAGFFSVSMAPVAKGSAKAFASLTEELAKILSQPPTEEEFNKAISNFESDRYYNMQTVDGLARTYGSFQDLFEDFNYYEKFLKKLKAVKPQDITALARKYLKPETLTLTGMAAAEFAEAQSAAQEFLKNYKKVYKESARIKFKAEKTKTKNAKIWRPKAQAKELFKKVKLDSGATLIYKISRDTPVISLRTAMLGGMRAEASQKQGETELMARTWVSGTKQISEADLHNRLEKCASGISAFGGRNTSGLNLSTLSTTSDQVLEIFEGVMTEPVLTDASFEREKKILIEEVKQRADHPAQECMRLFAETFFAGHPYGKDLLGSKESLEKLTKKDLVEHRRKMLVAQNLNIVAVGDIDENSLVKKINDMTSRLPRGEKMRIEKMNRPDPKIKTAFKKSTKEQTHLILGYPGLTFLDAQRHTIQIMQSILSGQGGRLFFELRDKNSLAYSVSPMRMEGLDSGYFGAYIGCSPEKAKKAIEMMKVEFQKLMNEQVSEVELERAKKFIIGKHDIELQKNSAVASSVLFDEVYGLDFDETFHFAEKVREVSAQDVRSLSQKLFSVEEVISVVGQVSPW